ncbi:MAG: hypothetical protein HYY26_06370, partial [Acidobacteria bacterium]|nr:hypothetical protein [Acidobacteriota bacterium]
MKKSMVYVGVILVCTALLGIGSHAAAQPPEQALPSQVSPKAHLPPAHPDDLDKVTTYVSVNVHTNWGPLGVPFVPPGLSDVSGLKKLAEDINKAYRFPSLYFQISASPLFVPVIKDEKTKDEKAQRYIERVLYEDRDAEWMDVAVELTPVCKAAIPAKECTREMVRVLALIPSETAAGTKERLPTQVASALGELSNLMTPFFPGSAFAGRFSAGAAGLGILFRHLFPPRVVHYQFAYIETSNRFGWFFRRDPSNPEKASILGLHHTVVLLQVDEKVERLRVSYSVLSRWNKRPNAESDRYDWTTGEPLLMELPQPPAKP